MNTTQVTPPFDFSPSVLTSAQTGNMSTQVRPMFGGSKSLSSFPINNPKTAFSPRDNLDAFRVKPNPATQVIPLKTNGEALSVQDRIAKQAQPGEPFNKSLNRKAKEMRENYDNVYSYTSDTNAYSYGDYGNYGNYDQSASRYMRGCKSQKYNSVIMLIAAIGLIAFFIFKK